MLVYRLIHYKDTIPDIDIGVKRLNRELCKPYIQLFYGTNVQQEVEETLQKFLDSKNNRKSTTQGMDEDEANLIVLPINRIS